MLFITLTFIGFYTLLYTYLKYPQLSISSPPSRTLPLWYSVLMIAVFLTGSLYNLANAVKYLSAAGASEAQHIELSYGGLTSEHDQQNLLSALDELNKNEDYEYGLGYTELIGSLLAFSAGGIFLYQLLHLRKNKPSS